MITIEELERELRDICSRMGRTDDLDTLRGYLIVATALWARIERLTPEPKQTA